MFAIIFSCLATLATLPVLVDAGVPGSSKLSGVTRLLGSSFGVPGINLTFDYVVRSPFSLLSALQE